MEDIEVAAEDTSSLKEIAKYGAGVSAVVATVNPIVGGVGLVICGSAYIVAGAIDRWSEGDDSDSCQ
jgi:hypothetical protein